MEQAFPTRTREISPDEAQNIRYRPVLEVKVSGMHLKDRSSATAPAAPEPPPDDLIPSADEGHVELLRSLAGTLGEQTDCSGYDATYINKFLASNIDISAAKTERDRWHLALFGIYAGGSHEYDSLWSEIAHILDDVIKNYLPRNLIIKFELNKIRRRCPDVGIPKANRNRIRESR